MRGKVLACTEWGGAGLWTDLHLEQMPLASVESRLDKGHKWGQGNQLGGCRCHPDKG